MANLFRRLNPTRHWDGLWRHGDFVRLWTSLTITHFGGQITFLALPLTGALLLDATPLEMGFLTRSRRCRSRSSACSRGFLVDRAPKLPINHMVGHRARPGLARGAALRDGSTRSPWGCSMRSGSSSDLEPSAAGRLTRSFMTERVGRGNLVEANAKIG